MLGWFNVIDARGSLESAQEAKEVHAQGLAKTWVDYKLPDKCDHNSTSSFIT